MLTGQHADRDPALNAPGRGGHPRGHRRPEFVDARVGPRGASRSSRSWRSTSCSTPASGGLHELFRNCALAVLNCGSDTDDAGDLRALPRFDIRIVRQACGIKLELRNAPASAFVDGEMIRGINEQLFAVLRDVVYIANEIVRARRFDLRAGRHHQRRVPHPAQRARAASRASTRPGGLLGRPFHRPRGIRVHQAGRLRARPARPRHLHRLRPGRDEGPDEGRHHRPRQAAHPAAAATSASPSPASSPPSRRTRSSTSW